jgi:hypothetical protein
MENFCCCKERPGTTNGQDIFNILSSYLESCGFSWSRCVGICTDRLNKRLCYTLQGKNPDAITTHCFLHREVLVSQTIGEDLKQVLDVAVNMVNVIKQRPLKSRMFAKLSENMQKDHLTLLQHIEVRWLSRGKVLTSVFELREELLLFLEDNNKASFSDFLEDTKWLLKLVNLADVYQHLNTLNTSMQGPKENVLTSTSDFLR